MAHNIFYAQSGGPTAVINATACGVIQAARRCDDINKVLVGKNGIIGGLTEEMIDTSLESAADIEALRYAPGSAFGSCRYKLKDIGNGIDEYARLIEVFKQHDIRYFLYNGGGDSQDSVNKIFKMSQKMQYPLTCIGIPKTIDNDLLLTDTCPGFGSVAKYVAISTQEAAYDVRGMAASSTQVFILEVMGRHAGWIATAAGLGKTLENDPPHILLLPEIAFE